MGCSCTLGHRSGPSTIGANCESAVTLGHRAEPLAGFLRRFNRVFPVRLCRNLLRENTQGFRHLRVDAKCAIERIVHTVRPRHMFFTWRQCHTQAGLLLRLRSVHLLSSGPASGWWADRSHGSQIRRQYTERIRHVFGYYNFLHSFHLSLRLSSVVTVYSGRAPRHLFDFPLQPSAENRVSR